MKIREGYLVAYSGITGWGIHIYIHKGLIYVYIICVCVSISPPKIKIMTRNLQDMILGVPQGHPWCQGWPCPPSLPSGTLNVLQVPPSWPQILYTLLIQISTQNVQGVFLRVIKYHLWHQGWPCPPSLRSGTLNVLQVPPFLTPPSWHTSDWDINTKFSGYLCWGEKTSFMTSGTTTSSKSPVRNPQRPPSTPLLDPPFLTHF